jgi:iron complex outermembrane recepter protein
MKSHRLAKTVATVLALSSGVLYSTAQAAGASVSDAGGLEDIVVVAQKENIELQKAPVAITAIGGDAMAQLNIVNPIDLNGQVPGLVITQSEGYNRSVSIRGIGFNVPQDDSAQTSVSYHEDGIYVAFPVALDSGFLDVDHVEILRGPQGTVFGQNAIGGTINVISRAPSLDSTNGYVDVSTGSYSLEHVTAALNVPVSSTFALRAAIDGVKQDGYVKAVDVPNNPGFDLNNQNNWHVRLQGLWKPTDNLSATLRLEYASANQHETSGKNIDDPNTDPYQQSSDWPGQMIYNQQLAGLTVNYDFSQATLKFISSYQEVNHHGSVNEDGLNFNLLSQTYTPHDVEWFEHNSKSITEEINLQSKPGGAFDWIVGGFFLKSRTTVAYDQYNLLPDPLSLNGDPAPNLIGVRSLDNGAVGTFLTNAIYSGQLYFQNFGSEGRNSASVYGQTTYHLSDAVRFTAGLRYTHDHNTTWFDDFYNLFYPNTALAYEQSNDKLTWRVAMDYDITPTHLLYTSISTGFKPGGGNISNCPSAAPAGSGCPITGNPTGVPYQFQPETITAYEIGSKNSFWGHTLNVNVAAFLYDDKNMQFQAEDLINFQGGVANVPTTRIYGFETEVSALLPAGFRFDGNVTLEHGEITSHFQALDNVAGLAANAQYIATYGDCAFYGCNGQTGVGFNGQGDTALNALRAAAYRDIHGNPPPSLPSVLATVNLSHTLNFANGSSLLSRLSGQYRSDYATTVFGETPTYRAPSYSMVNFYAQYSLAPKNWRFSVAVNNLLDKAQVASRFTNQFGGETTQVYAPPRMVVIGAHYDF